MNERQRLLAFVVASGAVLIGLGVAVERWFAAVAGPEVELITQVKRAEVDLHLRLASGAELRTQKAQYQRLSVSVHPDGRRATLSATLDFTGKLGATTVSSLGLERVEFANDGRQWKAVAGLAPRLVAAVEALDARRQAIASGATPHPSAAGVSRLTFRSDAWYLRSERETVEVAEDYRLTGDRADQPIDERGTTRLTLSPSADGGMEFGLASDGGW